MQMSDWNQRVPFFGTYKMPQDSINGTFEHGKIKTKTLGTRQGVETAFEKV